MKKKKKEEATERYEAEADNVVAEELKHRLNAVLEGLSAEDAAKLQRRLRKLHLQYVAIEDHPCQARFTPQCGGRY